MIYLRLPRETKASISRNTEGNPRLLQPRSPSHPARSAAPTGSPRNKRRNKNTTPEAQARRYHPALAVGVQDGSRLASRITKSGGNSLLAPRREKTYKQGRCEVSRVKTHQNTASRDISGSTAIDTGSSSVLGMAFLCLHIR